MFQSHDIFSEGVQDLIAHVNYEKARDKFFLDGVSTNTGTSASEVNFMNFVQSVYRANTTKAKLYIYNSTIVSLYGYLENFLEGIAKEFIGKLNNSLQSYTQVPEKIRDIHIDASISLLSKVKKDRTIDQPQKDIAVKNIIKNMNNCVNEQADFKLNEAAYAIHTANFRYDNIHELFSKIGIEDLFGGVLKNDDFIGALLIRNSSEYVEKEILKRWIGQELDDLAQRRNEIAHGNITNDIESMDMFITRANLILKLSNAINDMVWRRYLSILMELSPPSVSLNGVHSVFSNYSSLGFSNLINLDISQKSNIEVGDLVKYGRRAKKYGVITSIIYNRSPVTNLDLPAGGDFAIGVDFKVKTSLIGSEVTIANSPPLRTQAPL